MTTEEILRYEELVKDNFPYEEDPEMRGEIVSLMVMAVEEKMKTLTENKD